MLTKDNLYYLYNLTHYVLFSIFLLKDVTVWRIVGNHEIFITKKKLQSKWKSTLCLPTLWGILNNGYLYSDIAANSD